MTVRMSGRENAKPGGTAGRFSLLSQRCVGTGVFSCLGKGCGRSLSRRAETVLKNNRKKGMTVMSKIPYKIYLNESEMPTAWYNLRADMKNKPAPLLNPGTHEPMSAADLAPVFCEELIQQELDNDTRFFEIPDEIKDFYKMYRPSPLVRAYCLEKKLDTPAKIYYKFEGNNTSGSHKLNSSIAQAYYAKKQGLKGVTTETGAGQWGTALSMACAYFDLDCKVYNSLGR